jgi:putative transposase
VKRKRFSVEQIVAVLKEHELGVPGTELCRRFGVSENTFYRWKKVYGGLEPSEARRPEQLEDENSRLKRLVAELTSDKTMLQDVVRKKVRPAARREVARYLQRDTRTYLKMRRTRRRTRRSAMRAEIVHRGTASPERGHDKVIGACSQF